MQNVTIIGLFNDGVGRTKAIINDYLEIDKHWIFFYSSDFYFFFLIWEECETKTKHDCWRKK